MQGLRCHFILMSFKSPTKFEVTSDMTIAVYWDVKYQIKQTNKNYLFWLFQYLGHFEISCSAELSMKNVL